MNTLIVGTILVFLLAAPKIWARYIFFKHNRGRQDLPETGGELVNHQLARLELVEVQLSHAGERSHYDPVTKSVCLTDGTMNNRSLTALVRAAFEVGHAIQDNRQQRLSHYRQGLISLAHHGERLGSGALLLAPLVAILIPSLGGWLLFCAVVSMLSGAMVHLVILPIEWQAGFHIALPMLKQIAPLGPQDQHAVRQILAACAFSHFAYALANLLDGRHWLSVLGLKQRKQKDC
ncbi:MAG: zinc metallopeptidase [Motiliproteus sp.]